MDATAGHKRITFMDARAGYHQIPLHEPDQEKTAFIMPRGIYCYTVMPFGLKNAGVTYQRLMNKIFKHLLGQTIEVYIDDMLVKSKESADHLRDLGSTFAILRKYGLKINASKCAFGVSSGKFLGYLVTHKGIEANPEQVQAVQNVQMPRTVKDIQKLTGMLAALN